MVEVVEADGSHRLRAGSRCPYCHSEVHHMAQSDTTNEHCTITFRPCGCVKTRLPLYEYDMFALEMEL